MKKLRLIVALATFYCSSQALNTVPNEELRAKAEHLMHTHIFGVEQLRPEGWTIEAEPVAMALGKP